MWLRPSNPLFPTILWAALVVVGVVFNLAPSAQAALTSGSTWGGMYFCKCICFQTNYTILPIYRPENAAKPCLTCTKQWCLDQKLPICIGADVGGTNPDTGTGKEGDVEGKCFQRDSPRDQLVVTLFLLTVFGLLLAAAIRGRMEKAGLNFSTPGGGWRVAGSKWWEFFLPSRSPPPPSPMLSLHGERRGSASRGFSPGVYDALPRNATD